MSKPKKKYKKKKKYNDFSYTAWKKQGEKSKNFDSWKIYILRCWDGKEEFYKCGKTFRKIEDRFKEFDEFPYKYEIVYIKTSSSSYKISKLEKTIHSKLKENKYTPLKAFSGSTECFSNIDNYDQQTT
tara:strand:+ start:488 stop:871 length:384 start_codon:yes stop_codon:yes gene_type:complete